MKKFALFFLTLLFIISCQKNSIPNLITTLVTDGLGVNDRSYNASAWEGILDFYGDTVGDEKGFGSLYDVVICNDKNRLKEDLISVSQSESDVIVLVSFQLCAELSTVALNFPNKKYITIDGYEMPLTNVQNYLFAAEEGSYLVGLVAALQSKYDGITDPKFGFIGGVNSDAIKDFELGYIQGIKSVLPDAKIYEYYVGDWSSVNLAAEKAEQWYDNDVYAVYTVAGVCSSGTIAQAIKHRKSGKNVWAIGVDKDQYEEGIYGAGKSAVLTSMIKRVDMAILQGLRNVDNNQFKSGSTILSLKENAVGFSKANTELGTEVVKSAVSVQNDIMSGKINVMAIYKDAQTALKIFDCVIGENNE